MKAEIINAAEVSRPSLWNPDALANWSLLLTPIFGAYLVAENYKATGELSDAKRAIEWFYFGFAVLLSAILLAPFGLFAVSMLIYIAYLLSWYFMSARKQSRGVMSKYGKNYERQPWGKVLVIGIASNVVWQLIVNATL